MTASTINIVDVQPLLLRPEDAARLLKVSRAAVYRLIRQGALPSVKVGGCRGIVLAELTTYVDRRAPGRGARSEVERHRRRPGHLTHQQVADADRGRERGLPVGLRVTGDVAEQRHRRAAPIGSDCCAGPPP